MPRKIVVTTRAGKSILHEAAAEDEAQLQQLLKDNPDLLPVEEFGMSGPLLVVGRETVLPSGQIDLVALAQSGDLLIIEFKTGPQNTDFRRALAQLLDYGSDVWRMSYEEFEATVPMRYFASDECTNIGLKRAKSLRDAASATWPDMADEIWSSNQEKLSQQLADGAFHYVLVAQRFTPTIERTAEYLNQMMPNARFYAVEIVRFAGEDISAFETRTILKPQRTTTTPAALLDEEKFLETVSEPDYRAFLQEFFESCRGLGLRFEWGAAGASIRLPTSDRPEPLTVAWVFQSSRGWMGLRDLNFGFDPWSANRHPSVASALERYLGQLRAIAGVEPAKAKGLTESVYRVPPPSAVENAITLKEIMASLVSSGSSGE